MFAISGEIAKTVKTAHRSWKLTELTDKATQTMPLERLQQSWQEKGSEENEKKKKRPREEETEGGRSKTPRDGRRNDRRHAVRGAKKNVGILRGRNE